MPGNTFVGLISGTSMDGIDAVVASFDDDSVGLAASQAFPYPQDLGKQLRDAIRNPDSLTVDALGELDTRTGEAFRDAALGIIDAAGLQPEDIAAIGSHGQTVRHRPDLDHPFTLQIGNPAVISTGTGITTVADFRRTDLALGGEGAPLVPPFHAWLLREAGESRAVLNIGGIANLTLLSGSDEPVTGFDTGPGNTLLDAWVRKHRDEALDAGGRWAATGKVDEDLLAKMLADPWFTKPPPKSTGFEYFNVDWLAALEVSEHAPEDVQATLLELTAVSIGRALTEHAPGAATVFVCGGGVHNARLLDRLAKQLQDGAVRSTADAGIDPDWVEAAAFAWLAMRTLAGQAGNLPSVTGARRDAVLGGIYPA